MTFSIAARCPRTGMLGVAVSSSSIGVTSRCAHVRPRVGAALSQNVTDPALGSHMLDFVQGGLDGPAALDRVVAAEHQPQWRQLVIVPLRGTPAIHTGANALGVSAQALGGDCASAGNLLADPAIPRIMVDAFETSRGHLADRLLAALRAAVVAGGEAGPLHAAGLMVADAVSWPVIDLRVDWSEAADPVGELEVLWRLYRPQLHAYVERARDPDKAPSYGVPGDP